MKRSPALAAALLVFLSIMALNLAKSDAQEAPGVDALERGFKNPPDSAKPRTWWHWTMGNVTQEGITKDLEWMKRVGIGGFQLADVNSGRGQSVEKKIDFGSPEWLDAVHRAASEADRLGLEMAIFSSPGWSETGGPWVKPEQAMKKLVWSETAVEGPRHFTEKLPPPPSNNGPIRNLGIGGRGGANPDPTYYGDSAVIAYRTPAAETHMADFKLKVTTQNGPVDAAALLDDNLNSALTVPAPKDGSAAWVQLEFAQPFPARAIAIGGTSGIPVGCVLASDDGTAFRTLVTLPGAQLYRQGRVRTFAFPPTTARYYRIEMTGAPLGPAATMSQFAPQPAAQYSLTELNLHSGARINRWEEKAGFSFLFEYGSAPPLDIPAETAIERGSVIDLTGKMAADGTLNWEAPAGKWTILRLGYSLTGAKNRPATPAGSGYEADKLSRKHMESYYHGYFDPISAALGPLFGKSLRYAMMDSWEAGTENWTEEIASEFRKRRGYDPTPYLPALLGRVVENADVSDRFLWDFRRTLADLWADSHYGAMTDLLHQHGVGVYAEAAGVSLEIPEDTLLNKSRVDIPMGEFWVRDLHPHLMYVQDVRGAASAGHVYGKNIVAAEAFTGGGYESPYALKQIGDYWFAQGINRIVFHTSAHQPFDTKPGNTMVGTHINRNITWAEQAAPFMTYLARTSYLLQQGQPVADLAYLLDEGAPSTPPIWGAGTMPKPPEGYDYDFINADALLNRLSVSEDGRLTLPDSMSYRALVLPETECMRPELLRKIRELVSGGATIIGRKPSRSPSLAGYPASDNEVRPLASEIWGDLDGASRTTRRLGKGTVYWGLPLEKVLAAQNIAKDFEYSRALDADVAWIHRRAGEADIYYVANLTDHAQEFDARFRVVGKEAEIWHADSGEMETAGYAIAQDRTIVSLRLAEHESVFVVFRRKASAPSRPAPAASIAVLRSVSGPWDVSFSPNLGAPANIQFARLESWTANADEGIKFFSGAATYAKAVQAEPSWFRTGAKILLNLGAVKDIAEVSVNGQSLGALWKAPYQVDVTGALKPGANRLEIKVTNQWTNRLLGDRALPADKKVLGDSGVTPDRIGEPIQTPPKSGLLGPVEFISRADVSSTVADARDDSIAGIAANYTEAQAGSYTLPDPLTLASGEPVRDAKTWLEKRRPEILRLFEENQFGRSPERPADLSFDVFDEGTPAFESKALRRQVTIYFTKEKTGPKMELLLYLPAAPTKPAPVLLNASFTANNVTVDDPGVKQGTIWDNKQKKRVPVPPNARRFGQPNIAALIERGIGVATLNYTDIEPDALGATAEGVRGIYLKPGQTEPAPDEWGAIAAWGWGLSRALDYLETDAGVDAKRVALVGASRLGKTVLWAGARDSRFACVIASASGEGGAALSRRNYGETVAHLVAPTRYPYQFCANYQNWAGKADQSPVDAHLLVSLIAPRPLLLQTGDTDRWSDPKGEFLAATAATPVYRLLGKQGVETAQMPAANQLIGGDLAYFMHAGGHGPIASDWEIFAEFLRTHMP